MLLPICLGALALRIIAAQFVAHPGIADPNHYYNLGVRLVEGHGYTIDYIWQYNDQYETLVHPDDYWMPLTAVIAALPMALFGTDVRVALLPFMLLGALLPAVTFLAARQFGVGAAGALFAAVMSAVLPESVLNAVRTDTTIPNAVFVSMAVILFTAGMRSASDENSRRIIGMFVGSGVFTGLAYLTRSDSALLLPAFAVTVAVYWLWGRPADSTLLRRRWLPLVALTPLVAVLLALPWSLRNLALNGTISTPTTSNMFFLTDYLDHYVYARDLSLDWLLAAQTPAQIISKRLFEMAASFKLMYTTLDVFLPVAVAGGLLLLVWAGNADPQRRQRWLTFAPTLILLGGLFVFYTVLAPYKSQGGSFKKAYLSLLPLILPLAGYALERVMQERRLFIGVTVLAAGFMTANALELVRADAGFTRLFMDANREIAQAARAMPDTNGDGEIILMAQDPFMLSFFGVQSVVIPTEDRATILEIGQRYGVDYLLMPPDRPSLDPIFYGGEFDPRFPVAAPITGTDYTLYHLNADGDSIAGAADDE